ncbi:hypothetical protein HYW17_04405 [Candidatus Uhrbacteria bacterium]|nr:hypothetical protein [Candidatus Uhrbacteria bacterium]
MKRPEWQSSRDDLAGQLKQETSHEQRRAKLQGAKLTNEYQAAQRQEREERQRWYDLIAHLSAEGSEAGRERREAIMEGAENLAALIVRKFPQRNPDGTLHYYFVGSLGATLLAAANKITRFKPDALPGLVEQETKDIPPQAQQALQRFARPIGDIDFVRLGKRRAVDLGKGGGSIYTEELDDSMKRALADTSTHSLFTEPVAQYVSPRVVRIETDQGEIYVADPEDILRVKAEHIAQNFGMQPGKAGKFHNDFISVLNALEAMGYTRDDLVRTAHDTLLQSLSGAPNNSHIPLQSAQFGGELKRFFQEIVARDPDAEYLEQLPWAKERAIGIYKILHRFEDSRIKQQAVNLIKAHREQVDEWVVVEGSELNRERLAAALYNDPELREDFGQRTRIEEPTAKVFSEALKTHVWAFREYAQRVPSETLPDRVPAASQLLEVLVRVSPEHAKNELELVETIIRKYGSIDFWLEKLFRAPSHSTTYDRPKLMELIEHAYSVITDEKERSRFLSALSEYITEESIIDRITFKSIRLNEEQRVAGIEELCQRYGIVQKV